MNRLQKKCLMVSLALHGLLLLVLVVGPAFLPSKTPPVNDLPILDFVPANLIDAAFSGGGDPSPPPRATRTRQERPQTPQARVVPPAPKPTPPPQLREETAPPPERAEAPKTPKNPKINEESLDPPEPAKKPKPKSSILKDLVVATRTSSQERSTSRETARAREREREDQAREAEAAAEQRALLDGALSALKGGLSGSTTLQAIGTGVGGTGGPSYANYDQYVKSTYDRAWILPQELQNTAAQSMSVLVRIVVARSGEILEARIETPSSSSALNQSVLRALDRVKSLRRFPEASKDEQRSYQIEFRPELKAKLP